MAASTCEYLVVTRIRVAGGAHAVALPDVIGNQVWLKVAPGHCVVLGVTCVACLGKPAATWFGLVVDLYSGAWQE